MSERAVVSLALLGPFIAGLVLAFLVQLIPRGRQTFVERFLVLLAFVSAVALDFGGEGASHGALIFELLTLPGILSFVTTRFVLARHAQTIRRHT